MQTSNNPDDPNFTSCKQRFVRERARCVWSFLQQITHRIRNLLGGRRAVAHVLNTCVADDTNTSLKCSKAERNVVHTVMNTVQSAMIRYQNEDWELLHIPTPVQCLESGKASSIHAAFTSWLICSAAGIGCQWQRLGCTNDLGSQAAWRTCIMIGDALKANDAAWKQETQILASARADPKSNSQRLLGMRFRCAVHQVALTRKPAVLAIESFWTTLVRLGHLYEGHSFRRALSAAIMSLVQKEGEFIRAWPQSTFGLIFLNNLLFRLFPVV